jgi:hypothetical protein
MAGQAPVPFTASRAGGADRRSVIVCVQRFPGMGPVKQGTYTMKFYAEHVSVGEFDDQYFQVSFDSEPPSEDDFDLSRSDHPYLIVQRQFEDDDGGVCYIETP